MYLLLICFRSYFVSFFSWSFVFNYQISIASMNQIFQFALLCYCGISLHVQYFHNVFPTLIKLFFRQKSYLLASSCEINEYKKFLIKSYKISCSSHIHIISLKLNTLHFRFLIVLLDKSVVA